MASKPRPLKPVRSERNADGRFRKNPDFVLCREAPETGDTRKQEATGTAERGAGILWRQTWAGPGAASPGRGRVPEAQPGPLFHSWSSPAASEPEQLAQPVTSSRKSHSHVDVPRTAAPGLGLGHAIGSPEPSPEERSALLPRVLGVPLPPPRCLAWSATRLPWSRACSGGLALKPPGSPSAWTAFAGRLRPPGAGNAFPFSQRLP